MQVNPQIEESWKEVLASEFDKSYFMELKEFLTEEKAKYAVYPPGSKIFNAFQLTPFNQGDLLPACAIQLPNGEKIECEIEVRYISKDEQHKKFHLGACFVNLDRTRKHTLQRFVAEAERELMRRKPKE